MQGRNMFIRTTSRQHTPSRIKIRRRHPTFKLGRLTIILSTSRLPQYSRCRHSLLVIMVITSMTRITTFSIFRRSTMRSMRTPNIPNLQTFQGISSTSRQVRHLLPRRFIMLMSILRFCSLIRVLQLLLSIAGLVLFSVPTTPSQPGQWW